MTNMPSCSFNIFLMFGLSITNVALGLKNERNVKGKVVIVTGAAQGIGYAIAENFAKKGAKVVILLDIQKEKGEQAERTLNSKYGKNKTVFIECDIRKDLDRVSKLIIKKYIYVDVLVNNVGIAHENEPKNIIETNVAGTILSSLRYVEHMRKDKGGKGGTIINLSSITFRNIDPIYPTYRASKLAVLGFSLSEGHLYNYNITGVRIITICPGPTDTALVGEGYCLYDKKLIDNILKYFKYSNLQSPDNVGRGAVKLFETAKSGTSWDITDGKSPVKSNYTLNIIPYEDVDNDENTNSKKAEANKNPGKKEQKRDKKNTQPKKDEKNDLVDALISVEVL